MPWCHDVIYWRSTGFRTHRPLSGYACAPEQPASPPGSTDSSSVKGDLYAVASRVPSVITFYSRKFILGFLLSKSHFPSLKKQNNSGTYLVNNAKHSAGYLLFQTSMLVCAKTSNSPLGSVLCSFSCILTLGSYYFRKVCWIYFYFLGSGLLSIYSLPGWFRSVSNSNVDSGIIAHARLFSALLHLPLLLCPISVQMFSHQTRPKWKQNLKASSCSLWRHYLNFFLPQAWSPIIVWDRFSPHQRPYNCTRDYWAF